MSDPKSNISAYTIGKLAAAADVNIETVRYYQRLKLILEPVKPAHGYRQYSADYLSRILFIKRTQSLGFTLKEIQELLDLGDGHCQEVQQLAEDKIVKIEERLSDLQAMRSALKDLLIKCQTNNIENAPCALIKSIGIRREG
ncbi:MAG: MerR family DNA-binding protein [Ectothiorhodospiraceae bacterium]|nr:MerR family DNA-binding protein [Ectothiorhodospiraceae bacterium]